MLPRTAGPLALVTPPITSIRAQAAEAQEASLISMPAGRRRCAALNYAQLFDRGSEVIQVSNYA
jgi:hypothetical protein